ncbi:MAG: hypothetical protein ACREEM_30855 [Blastocatellia bacterium]
MNERLLIRLMQDGAPLKLDAHSSEGVTLHSERDAWPRGLTLEFDTESPITRLRMDQVRQRQGWGSREYKLSLSLEDGALAVTGVEPRALPAGHYWFRLRIGDLVTPAHRTTVELREGRETRQDLEVRSDPRQVEILLDAPRIDPQIRRVLAETSSKLDGLPLLDWLRAPQPRASRKACLLNLLAKLRAVPTAGGTLLAHVRQLSFADVDRCYAAIDGELFTQLKALARAPGGSFSSEHAILAPVHRKLRRHIESIETDAAHFRLHSFRQEGGNSLQAVIAEPPDGDPSRRFYADFDIDLGNPLHDLKGFFIHLGELLSPGKTDHLKLREKLADDQMVREFLYYRVIDE